MKFVAAAFFASSVLLALAEAQQHGWEGDVGQVPVAGLPFRHTKNSHRRSSHDQYPGTGSSYGSSSGSSSGDGSASGYGSGYGGGPGGGSGYGYGSGSSSGSGSSGYGFGSGAVPGGGSTSEDESHFPGGVPPLPPVPVPPMPGYA